MTPVRPLNLYLNRNSRTMPRVLVFRTRSIRPATAGSVSVPRPRFWTAALVSLARGRDIIVKNRLFRYTLGTLCGGYALRHFETTRNMISVLEPTKIGIL